MSLLTWLHRAVLRLVLPRDERARRLEEMDELFQHCLAVERRRRPRTWSLTGLRGVFQTFGFAVAIRRAASADRSTAAYLHERRTDVKLLDFRSTFRMLRHRPLFGAGVLLMLGLGIGATTAIFSVVDGVLLRPLPFPDQGQLVQVFGSVPSRNIEQTTLTQADSWDIRDMNRTLSAFGIWHGASFTLLEGDAAERISGGLVSVGFFAALNPRPVLGRLFVAGEDAPGASTDRVLLSNGFWTRRFGADRSIVGRQISIDGQLRQVVGVLPPGTPWLDISDVFVPFPQRANVDRSSWEYLGVGRMRPGVTLEAVNQDLRRVGSELSAQYAKTGSPPTRSDRPCGCC
jgi:putative ABC transport system permease protein